MSTREIAYSIIDRLSERQLRGFIAMFGESDHDEEDNDNFEEERRKSMAAFERLNEMIKEVPDLDYEKELAEYRDERYGQGL